MMTRRTFIHRTGSAAAALALPGLQPAPRFKMGLQLFTVRAPMRTDVAGTIQKIAAMGYEEAETYGFDPDTIGFYGMPAKAFADTLRANRITTPSGHYDLNRYAGAPMEELTRYVDRCIEGAKILGQSYITWPYLDEPWRTLDKIRIVAQRLNVIGAQIKKAGLQLAYHHHDFEFVNHDGQIGFDIILKETDPALVKMQTDLYWMAHAAQNVHEWFLRAPGRFVMWHVKDMHKVSRDYTELGNGSIDFTKIWPDTKLSGLRHYFVEQGGNFAKDPLSSVAQSAEYMKKVSL
jgi:sugar phosphate isomerase/epimerase